MRILLAALCLVVSSLAHAQAACRDDETVGECLTRVLDEHRQSTAEVVSRAVADAETGAAVANQPGAEAGGARARSTVTDLIPWLNAMGLLSDSDASDGSIAVDLNFLLPGFGRTADRNAQLSWVIDVEPEPFEPLINAFPEAVRGERRSALAQRIADTGDSELQLTGSWVNERLGRDFRQHYETLQAMYFPAILSALRAGDGDLQRLRRELLQRLSGSIAERYGTLPEETKREVDEAMARVPDIAAAQTAVAAAIERNIAAVELDRAPELVLQQPQLLFSVTRRFRDELVGPDAWGVKVRYEHSFASFGQFLRTRGKDACSATTLSAAATAAAPMAAAGRCYDALRSYLRDKEAALANESRLTFSLEYRRVDSLSLAFPDDGVALSLPETDRLIASLGFGRALPNTAAADRVDLQVDYDSDIDGDGEGTQSRFVASLTYTRRIGDLDLPFSVVYANKSEFLDGVDKRISLNVGVKFRALSETKR